MVSRTQWGDGALSIAIPRAILTQIARVLKGKDVLIWYEDSDDGIHFTNYVCSPQ